VLSGAQLVKALERAGFTQVRTKGSHVIMRSAKAGRSVTVPLHTTVERGTLAAILRQVGLDQDDLSALL
jgi:predicted RNA binding protein YcfA (HicA-like mRNA interferase family)